MLSIWTCRIATFQTMDSSGIIGAGASGAFH